MTLTHCPDMDSYRKTFATMESKSIKFDDVRSVPLKNHDNYIKQEWLYFWRVSEIEYLQYNNE